MNLNCVASQYASLNSLPHVFAVVSSHVGAKSLKIMDFQLSSPLIKSLIISSLTIMLCGLMRNVSFS